MIILHQVQPTSGLHDVHHCFGILHHKTVCCSVQQRAAQLPAVVTQSWIKLRYFRRLTFETLCLVQE